MRWSWKIGRIAGIDLRVHATFLLILVWAALAGYAASGTATGAVSGVLFILALFVSVVLHEFGHALAAKRFGVTTRDITLLPIGGIAHLEEMPKKPSQELRVALAGPAVTLAIILLLYGALFVLGRTPLAPIENILGSRGNFLEKLMLLNAWLLIFNLLPAFPMDGGRVLRATLALRMPYTRATAVAARIGQMFALFFGIVGLFYSPFLVLIALFVWLAAAAESAEVQRRSSLEGVPVERVMIRDVQTLTPRDPLNVALEHVLSGFQQDFPVVDAGRVVGVLTRARMLEALAKVGRDVAVGDVMETTFRTTDPGEPVERALSRLQECRCRTLPVMTDHRLDGMLTLDNVVEFIMIESALRSESAPRTGA